MKEKGGFTDKVAIVVGGSSGMGNAVVHLLLEAGSKTHVLDIKETKDGSFQYCAFHGKTFLTASNSPCGF